MSKNLRWIAPLDLAARIDEPDWVLLYSVVRTAYSGRFSYLACGLAERIEGNDFSALEAALRHTGRDQAWFGYLGYGLKDCLEELPADTPHPFALPALQMLRFRTVYVFDHDEKRLSVWGEAGVPPEKPASPASPAEVCELTSNMTRGEYLDKAAEVIAHIHAGDLYQANLTRKFSGRFRRAPDAFALFKTLCNVSPAPYSAFLKLGKHAVLSSSPEQFLSIDTAGNIRTRPIKGTAPRFDDPGKDAASREALRQSAKDRAENLMIVDLMRNDLSRSCVPGSVEVEALFDVTSHATIHHLSSTVVGRRRPQCSTLDVIKGCFPPGSMTGAPKIRAMQLCSELERQARGIYSGAIGRIAGDGSAELSVVIRTLILMDDRFEFQVGGGIVADSTPEQELQELFDKSRGILSALGMEPVRLEQL